MHLLDFPDELLFLIIERLSDKPEQPFRSSCLADLLALTIVCRRISVLAEKFLYRHVRIDFDQCVVRARMGEQVSSRVLLNALKERPSRYCFLECLDVCLTISSVTQSHDVRQSLLALLKESPNIERLRFWCYYDVPPNFSIFQILSSRKLQTLEVNVAIVKDLTRPGILSVLKNLSIYQDIWADRGGSSAYHGMAWKEFRLPVERQAISSLRQLHVGYYDSHPCVLLPLLQWPARLETLDLDFLSHSNAHLQNFSVAHLQHMLDTLANVLKRAVLRNYGGKSILNFRHFNNLLELQISHYELFQDSPEEVAYKLAGSNLASLRIDFDQEDQQDVCFQRFEPMHQSWLERWCKLYKTFMDQGGIARIKVINVKYHDEEDQGDQTLRLTQTMLEQMKVSFTWSETLRD